MPSFHRSAGSAARRQRGAGLIEALVVALIIALLAGAATAGYSGLAERQRMRSLGALLETDLHFARSESLSRSRSVRVSFPPAAGGTCWVIHTGPANACSCSPQGLPACNAAAEPIRSHHVPMQDGVWLASNARSLVFDPRRHTVTPAASVSIHGRSGRTLRQVVNIMGRVRTCTPNGFPAAPRC